jgi:hypothetical protein
MSLRAEVNAVVPLALTVNSRGGVTGLSPTASVRRGTDYLDWNDNTFKAAGWTERDRVLTEIGGGHYTTDLDLGAVGAVAGETLVVEYATQDVVYPGATSETLTLERDTDFLRKMSTNRMEQTSGTPGQLVLFDDDGTTPYRTWAIRDEFGGGIAPQVNVPARRGAAT